MNCLIIRYSEIALKGKNRSRFERKLVSNIKDCLKKNKLAFERIARPQGRIIVYAKKPEELAKLQRVFGIRTISPAEETTVDIEQIKKAVAETITKARICKNNTFRITARRIDKTAKYSSQELNIQIGDFVRKKTKARVNLENYDYEFGIELFSGKAYIFLEKIKCLGGLPVGIEGKVAALIEDNASLLAALLVMKRGCSIIPITITTTNKNINLLKNYSYGYDLKLQKMKSLTMKEVEKLKPQPLAIVTNQTIENFKQLPIEKEMMVLRPLISYDGEQINKQLNNFKSLT